MLVKTSLQILQRKEISCDTSLFYGHLRTINLTLFLAAYEKLNVHMPDCITFSRGPSCKSSHGLHERDQDVYHLIFSFRDQLKNFI